MGWRKVAAGLDYGAVRVLGLLFRGCVWIVAWPLLVAMIIGVRRDVEGNGPEYAGMLGTYVWAGLWYLAFRLLHG